MMNSSKFKLTLVRHAQTSSNKEKIIQGQLNTKLDDIGREQANKLGDYFRENSFRFDLIYSSDLDRAFETAEICLTKMNAVNHENSKRIQIDQRLRERCFGVMEGSSSNSYRNEAKRFGYNQKNSRMFTPNGGETLDQLNTRVKDFYLNTLLDSGRSNSNILIVTHGGVICEFMRIFYELCNFNIKNFQPFKITPNTAFSILDFNYGDNQRTNVDCVQLHYTPHLISNHLRHIDTVQAF